MTRFEEKGCDLQMGALSVAQSKQRFTRTCDLCIMRGRNASCDSCPVKSAYETTQWLFSEVYNRKARVFKSESIA